jgi:radical SAM superfamily enzyme YgiQ (UPF0313 family)
MILLGVEAETEAALKDANKRLNLKKGTSYYRKAFRKIQKHGIGVLGAMIFGMESDGKEDLYNRMKFVMESGMDAMQTSIMTPLPGTELYDRLQEEGRIESSNYPDDWKHYHFKEAVMGTSKITRQELQDTMKDIWMVIYKKENLRRMMFRSLRRTRNFNAAYWVYGTNHNYGRMTLEHMIGDKPGGITRDLTWEGKKRSFYLQFTDLVLKVFYLI